MRRFVPGFLILGTACTATPVDHAPEVLPAQRLVVPEDTAVAFDLLATDADGDELSITVDDPAHGSVVSSGGRYNYIPDANFDGADLITATVSDGRHAVIARLPVLVAGVDDRPIGRADKIATDEDTDVTVPLAVLLANDVDPEGHPVAFAGFGRTEGGTLVRKDGRLTFSPFPDFAGVGGFAYTVTDGSLTAPVWVVVTIGAVNDAPVTEVDALRATEDVALAIDPRTLLDNDRDRDGHTLWIHAVGGAVGGTVTLANDAVVFTPDADHHGIAGFEYTATDGLAADVGWAEVDIAPVTECGDSEIDRAYDARSITFTWLATACDGPNEIAFSIGGVEVVRTTAAAEGCSCNPGVRSLTLTDRTAFDLLDGDVELAVSAPGRTLLAWATAEISAADSKRTVVLHDAGGGTDALDGATDVCLATATEDTVTRQRQTFGEQCDDGNDLAGDGCSAACLAE